MGSLCFHLGELALVKVCVWMTIGYVRNYIRSSEQRNKIAFNEIFMINVEINSRFMGHVEINSS